MEQWLDIAVQFRESRGAPVFCGEFGVFIENSPETDRINWYRDFRQLLDSASISWTSWDYHGGFGLFEKNSQGLFDHNLNVPLLEAMGFNVPPQTPLIIQPDTAGFFIYRDFIEEGIQQWGSGFNLFTQNGANYGQYHIEWRDQAQYSSLGFNYSPNKDLSILESNDFALDFFVRASSSVQNSNFDVRFVDSKTQDSTDLPWRNRYTFSPTSRGWEHYHIPLSDFVEHGSYFNNTWHSPRGEFDWQDVDLVEFVAEYGALNGILDVDHVQLTNVDSAMVNNTTSVIGGNEPLALVYPNPFSEKIKIRLLASEEMKASLVDVMGREVWQGSILGEQAIELPQIQNGLYFFITEDKYGLRSTVKLWKK
ncbi:MAG: T9SS type A sorting domain-containing protein [Bacteroidia bacterium]|nr:T9SS type A sorting domain-containing protein [Bacteroidia bacterium]